MASGVMFAELHVRSGEHLQSSDRVGVATSPALSLFKRRRGQLFTVLEPSRPESDGICQRLIQAIEDEYFRDSSRSITSSLRSALVAANEVLLAENSKFPPDKQFRVGVCCAAVRDEDVFIAQVAPANAFILHEGVVRRVFSSYSLVSETGTIATSRASDSLGSRLDPHVNFGFSHLEQGDIVVLASGAYWKLVPDRYILEASKHADPDIAASELYGCYTAHSRRPTTSLVVVRVGETLGGQATARNVRTSRETNEPAAARRQAASQARTRVEMPERGSPGVIRAILARLPLPFREQAEKGQAVRSSAGKASVKLRKPPPMRSERRRRPRWISTAVNMLALAAVFVALGGLGITAWRTWLVGDPVALMQQAQEKRALAASAETQSAARALLSQSYELVSKALQAGSNQDATALASTVLDEMDKLDGVVRINRATPLVDFAPIADKSDLTQIVVDGDALYVLDEAQDRVLSYTLGADGRSVQDASKHASLVRRGERVEGKVAGDLLSLAWMPAGQLRTAPALFMLESGRSVLSYDRAAGLSRIDVAESNKWGTIQTISGFGGGLYLLDTKNRSVYYYPPTKGGYESQPYTIIDSRGRADLSKAIDIVLDGNLYTLESNGTIRRFTREGRPLDFVGDLPNGPVKAPKGLFASAATRSVYLLDAGEERIVQFTPEGKFQRQLKADGKTVAFKEVRDLFVDEAARRVYLLARKSLVVFDLPPVK